MAKNPKLPIHDTSRSRFNGGDGVVIPAPKRPVPPRVRDGLRTAIVNLRWLSRAIEDGAPLERAIGEVYSMKIYGFAGDLRTLLKEVDK